MNTNSSVIYSCFPPGLPQVETIGDAYMAVTNLVDPDPHHAATMIRFAQRAQEEAAKVPQPGMDDGSTLKLRIGEGAVYNVPFQAQAHHQTIYTGNND